MEPSLGRVPEGKHLVTRLWPMEPGREQPKEGTWNDLPVDPAPTEGTVCQLSAKGRDPGGPIPGTDASAGGMECGEGN